MAKKQIMICEGCKESSEVKVKHTTLGFPTMKCPKCQHLNTYPLSKSYRNGYIAMVVIGVLALIWGLATGQTVVPGILFVAACIALYSDNKKRKKVNIPQNSELTSVKETDQKKAEYCGQCGSQLDQNSIFCQDCGTKKQKS